MDHKRAEEVAVNRLQIISPMLDPALDKAKKQDINSNPPEDRYPECAEPL